MSSTLRLALLIALLLPFQAHAEYPLECKPTAGDGRVYYMTDPVKAQKCRYSIESQTHCTLQSGGTSCTWSGHYFPKATATKTATATNTKTSNYSATNTKTWTATKTSTAWQTDTETSTSPELFTDTDTETETEIEGKDDLKKAIKEAELSSSKRQELKITMEELKVSNENNATLYRSPKTNMQSGGISGELVGSALLGKPSGSLSGDPGKSALQASPKEARNKASDQSSGAGSPYEIGKKGNQVANQKADASSATSDNPWVNYMGQSSMAALIDRLRKNPALRDSLRERIAELQSQGDKSGVVELMEEALADSRKEDLPPLLDNLKPMSIREAFSMNEEETASQIRSLLAELDQRSDPQFLPQMSLFERVSVAHRRSLIRGIVKVNR